MSMFSVQYCQTCGKQKEPFNHCLCNNPFSTIEQWKFNIDFDLIKEINLHFGFWVQTINEFDERFREEFLPHERTNKLINFLKQIEQKTEKEKSVEQVRKEKYVLRLTNGKYAKLQKFNQRIFDVFEVDDFSDATLLAEEEADFALKQQHIHDVEDIAYDFGEQWDELWFEKKLKVTLTLK